MGQKEPSPCPTISMKNDCALIYPEGITKAPQQYTAPEIPYEEETDKAA